MPKKTKLAKSRLDTYYKQAKQHGYRARSAFKLIQLNKDFNFLSKTRTLLDLCAAPGGWMQVAHKYMPLNSTIIGVDLVPIKPIPNCTSIVADITSKQCRELLVKELAQTHRVTHGKHPRVDTVIHDGAPNVGAEWNYDAFSQCVLTLHAMKLATDFLRKGGLFVTKVFRSRDYHALLWVMHQLFEGVESTKPKASRNTSAEIYVICKKFKMPDKIDQRLFDPEYVFKQLDNELPSNSVKSLFGADSGRKTRANRSGYSDDYHKRMIKAPVHEFIESTKAIEMLSTYSGLEFDDKSADIKTHTATTTEIQHLIQDFQVLGKNDFKNLLKWRMHIRAFRGLSDEKLAKKQQTRDGQEPKAVDLSELTEEQKEEAILRELDERERNIMLEKLRKQRKDKEKRAKLKAKRAKCDVADDKEILGNQNLFSLSSIQSEDTLLSFENMEPPTDLSDSDTPLPQNGSHEEVSDVEVTDEEQEKFFRLDAALDDAFEEYRQRKNIKTKKELKAERRVQLDSDGEENEAVDEMFHEGDTQASFEAEEDMRPANPRIAKLGIGESITNDSKVCRWFDKGIFAGIETTNNVSSDVLGVDQNSSHRDDDKYNEDSDDDDRDDDGDDGDNEDNDVAADISDDEDHPEAPLKKKRKCAVRFALPGNDEDDTISELPLPRKKTEKKVAKKDLDTHKGFEEVPANDSDWTSDEESQAEALAIGKVFLNKKKKREIIDASYNRFAFSDLDKAPDWFKVDQDKHNKAQLPITKEQADEFKQQLRAINARPIKKIAEARARKKMKAVKKWEKIKGKAASIAASSEGTDKTKLKAIQDLYSGKAGAKKPKKLDKQYVVTRKTGVTTVSSAMRKRKGPVKRVDKRMKADSRNTKMQARKGKRGHKRGRPSR